MSGIRWPHWKGGRNGVTGLNQARVRQLLLELQAQMKRTGIDVGSRVFKFSDGSVITVAITGEVATVRVQQVTGSPRLRKPVTDPSGFVVTARTTDLIDGILASNPQQQIIPDDALWLVKAYDDTITTGRADEYFAAEFPDGIRYAGNIDWTDGEVRISWYGPSRRYWYDGWRKPERQYNTFVFLNGSVLLDTTEHGAAALPYVMGAALVGNRLYVMQAAINAFDTDYDAMYPLPRVHSWVSPYYPDGDTALRLCRYTVTENPDTPSNAARYGISADSMETLWTDSRRGYVNPWFFNPTATVCETFAMPDELRHFNGRGGVPLEGNPQTTFLAPSNSNENMRLLRSEEDDAVVVDVVDVSIFAYASPGTSGFPPEYDAEAEIAADYAADGTRHALVYRHVAQAFPVFANFIEYHTLRVVKTPEPPEAPVEVQIYLSLQRATGNIPGELETDQHALLHADLRTETLATFRFAQYTGVAGTNFYRDIVLYQAGAEVSVESITSPTYIAYTPFGTATNQRGRGLNRFQGVRAFWSILGTSRTVSNTDVSPMVAIAGIGVDTITGRATAGNPATRYVEDEWVIPYLAFAPYLFPDEELEGKMTFPNTYRQTIGAASTSTAMLAFSNIATTLRGLSDFHDSSHPYFYTDASGMRVPNSVSARADGHFLASLTVPWAAARTRTTGSAASDHPDNNFYRTTVGVSFSSGPTLADLTGVDSAPGTLAYGNPVPNVYDARYSTVWQLGTWPKIAPRPPDTEE